jgi:hypothetical protein
VLVLTDVDISVGNQIINDNFAVVILVGSATQGTLVAARVAAAAAGGVVTATFNPPNGIAVKSGNAVCVQVVNLTRGGFVPILGVAHGFLAPDK